MQIVVCCVLLLALVAFGLSEDWHQKLSNGLQKRSVPTAMLDYGKLGDILKRNHLVFETENRRPSLPQQQLQPSPTNLNLFQKKRQESARVYIASPGGASGLPSSKGAFTAAASMPLLSIAIDEKALFDNATGIIANPGNSNRAREKPVTISVITDAGIEKAFNADIRLHGSRVDRRIKSNRPLSATDFAYEIHFRKRLNLEPLQTADWFDAGDYPLDRLIVDNNYGPQKQLASQILAVAGLPTPLSALMQVQVNGEYVGYRQVREPVDKEQWQLRESSEFIDFFSSRDDQYDPGWKHFTEMAIWYKQLKGRIDMYSASRYLDLQAFTSSIAVSMICGSSDWQQWAAYRNNETDGLWRWITWGLGSCVTDRWQTSGNSLAEQDWLQVVASFVPGKRELRLNYRTVQTLIFVNLMNEDPEYRDYFIETMRALLTQLENHNFEDLPDEATRSFGNDDFDVNAFIRARSEFISRDLRKLSDDS